MFKAQTAVHIIYMENNSAL